MGLTWLLEKLLPYCWIRSPAKGQPSWLRAWDLVLGCIEVSSSILLVRLIIPPFVVLWVMRLGSSTDPPSLGPGWCWAMVGVGAGVWIIKIIIIKIKKVSPSRIWLICSWLSFKSDLHLSLINLHCLLFPSFLRALFIRENLVWSRDCDRIMLFNAYGCIWNLLCYLMPMVIVWNWWWL